MAKQTSKQEPDTMEFHNKISPCFRSLHVDGAYGGITPKGLININFFSERFAIPKSSTYKLNDEQKLEKLKDSDDSKSGVVREYDMGIYIDIETAKKIKNLLDSKIKEFEGLVENLNNLNNNASNQE